MNHRASSSLIAVLAGASACTGVLSEPAADPMRWTADVKYVFVSSRTHDGIFDGLAGADQLCATLADAAALPGAYKAWMSTVDTAVADRFEHSAVPYKLVDGTTVAADWADLIDGTLDHAINLDERARPVEGSAWTFTLYSGQRPAWSPTDDPTSNPRRDCGGWQQDGIGGAGDTSRRTPKWTDAGGGGSCTAQMRIYCFEQ